MTIEATGHDEAHARFAERLLLWPGSRRIGWLWTALAALFRCLTAAAASAAFTISRLEAMSRMG